MMLRRRVHKSRQIIPDVAVDVTDGTVELSLGYIAVCLAETTVPGRCRRIRLCHLVYRGLERRRARRRHKGGSGYRAAAQSVA